MKFIKANFYLIVAICLFWVLFLPFIGSIPYLDGGIDFVKANDFYSGSFTKLFTNWRSIHPPLKEFAAYLFFKLLGTTTLSYTLIGLVFGSLGIVYFYFLSKRLLEIPVANISTLLLSTSPLFISAGLFSLTDFLLTILIIISLYYYSKEKHLAYSIFSSFAFLAKETAMILVVVVLLIELVYFLKNRKNERLKPSKFIYFVLPLLVTFIWFYFLKLNNKLLWQDWNFSQTAGKGTVYTIVNNLLTFNFLNKYAYQNWLQLFLLNFNWIYWLLIIVGIFLRPKIKISKEIFVILIFSGVYFLAVLSFQTYTIPRYALPLYPFMLMGIGYSATTLQKRFKFLKDKLVIFLVFIVAVSLFNSSDPISIKLWGKTKILGQEIYGLNKHLAGNDGMTYNMQYLFLVKERTKQIYSRNETGSVVSNDCYWVFPDPNNDFKVAKILNIEINSQKPCISKVN